MKKVRAGLEKNEYGRWEMKEEGRGPSKFPFLPPASPRPHDPGGRVNSACLLLINPWPALYGVATRAVLGSQEHFREQSFTPEKRNKAGTVPRTREYAAEHTGSLSYCLDLLPAGTVDKDQK